jgi:large subunit ribosomal protein L3
VYSSLNNINYSVTRQIKENMKFILATKSSMTQFFDDNGQVIPATILEVSPSTVTRVKTKSTDGYAAVQVGYGVQDEKRVSKSVKGSLKELGTFATLKEFRITEDETSLYTPGNTITAETFTPGDIVSVSGVSKGKGFQGVVKRHGFKGGWAGHGQKHSHREPGSIGGGGRAGGRVIKGMRMAGRMGNDRVTVKGLQVVAVDSVNNILLVKGAVPGKRGTLLEIKG